MFGELSWCSGWAVLASGALIASLLAVGASPAGAVNQEEDELTETWRSRTEVYGACPAGSDAVADHGFTDVSDDHAFRDVINCVAYYGITNGTGDGSTFSPNDEVTRAQMAVFIARAADVAGLSLGSGSGGFSDIGDVWQEAQDAINGLASMGMIPDGGEFRPDDAITRAEMATFMVGLLAEGASNVTINQDGDILLGHGGNPMVADDYFADARASVPRANDEQISALYELGVTKGASAIPGGPGRSHVLATWYTTAIIDGDNDRTNGFQRARNFQGSSLGSTVPLTLNDDGAATFSVAGLIDGAPADEEDKYEVDIRVQHTPPAGPTGSTAPPPLPYNYEPHGTVNRGQMAAFITRALAHTQARPEGITAQFADGNVVVSVRDENFAPVSNVVVDLFRIDTAGLDLAFRANGSCNEAGPMDSSATTGYTCEVDGTDYITGADGDTRVPLGDDVDDGGTTVWIWTGDDEDTVDDEAELFELGITEAEAAEPAVSIRVTTEHGGEKAHLGSSVLYNVQLVDKNGDDVGDPNRWYKRALPFSGVALFDDQGELDASGSPDTGILPMYTFGGNPTGQWAVADAAGTPPTGSDGPVIFSTEDGVLDASDIFVTVEPAAEFAVVDDRGADNRVTVTVTDQYGDPISGVNVRVDSVDTDTANDDTEIVVAGRYLTVGRDGSFSFGYERDGEVSATETLTAVIEDFDHDGDDTTAALMSIATADPMVASGSETVEWAVADTDGESDVQQIRAFDTEMNTIFAGANGSVQFVSYDSNDRFNIDRPVPEDGADDPPNAAASYAAFEKALSKAEGYTLTWSIVGRGSRATNEFNLIIPAAS